MANVFFRRKLLLLPAALAYKYEYAFNGREPLMGVHDILQKLSGNDPEAYWLEQSKHRLEDRFPRQALVRTKAKDLVRMVRRIFFFILMPG